MNQKKLIIALSIVILIIIGMASYFVFIRKSKPTIEKTPLTPISTLTTQTTNSASSTPILKNETDDWKIYRNEEYGFEVKYPQDKLYIAFENADEYMLILSRFKIYVPDFTIQESFLSEEDNCLWPKKCFAGWQGQEIYTYMKNIESNKKYELSCTDTINIIQGDLCYKIFSTFKFFEPIKTFPTQQECEQTTGKQCDFKTCDFIPKGKTYEEVCGQNFRKGWQSVN